MRSICGAAVCLTIILASKEEGFPEQLTRALTVNSSYTSFQSPMFDSDDPTFVSISMQIESLTGFEAKNMDFRSTMYLQMTWHDNRLHQYADYLPIVTYSQDLVEALWTPDLIITNSKDAKIQTVTVPNTHLLISKTGIVYLSRRITARMNCNMDLTEYPMDSQICMIYMKSYTYDERIMNLTWRVVDKEKSLYPLTTGGDVILPEFQLTNLTVEHCRMVYKSGKVFSCLLAEISLRRYGGFHFFQTFLPSIIVVAVSWLSFYLDPSAVPARITLGITTFLTLMTMASGLRTGLPAVSYIKAIDIWMMVCLMFLVCCLLEFVLINSLIARDQKDSQLEAMEAALQHLRGNAAVRTKSKQQSAKELAVKIDQWCRIIFPLLFLFFNICFWARYPIHMKIFTSPITNMNWQVGRMDIH